MTGASSTWYAIEASFSCSRSSFARSESVVELIGGVDDCGRPFGLELRAVVDPSPGDRDRVHVRGLRGADVERRVADVGAIHWCNAETLCGEQQRLGIRLVQLGLVAADEGLQQIGRAPPWEGEAGRLAPPRGGHAGSGPVGVPPP